MASQIRPGPTSSPASRSTRPNVTTWRTIGSATAGLRDERRERVVANGLEVLVVLQHRAEGLLDDLRVQLLAAEGGEGVRPVDRLRNAGRLRQVQPAQPADEPGGLGGQPLGDS